MKSIKKFNQFVNENTFPPLGQRDELPASVEMKYTSDDIDFSKDQHLMSIRSKGEELGHIEIEDGKIVTNGLIGDNKYNNFVELIKGLQGFDIKIDDFFW